MLHLFTAGMKELDLAEGERLIAIDTGNAMDELQAIVSTTDAEEIEDMVRQALRRKYGNGYTYYGFEDVTDEYLDVKNEVHDAWQGEGWYGIGFSDGGMDWTNDGPAWFETEDDLLEEMRAAYGDATEYHLPCIEYHGNGENPEE